MLRQVNIPWKWRFVSQELLIESFFIDQVLQFFFNYKFFMNCNYFFDILPIKLLLENLEIETFDSKFHFFLPKLILHHVENSFFLSCS